ncbi:MAG: fatty acid desaturase, partial [Pseudomonadota bacterium]
ESNYLDASVWRRLHRPVRFVLAANNTLLGRLIIGPAVAQVMFIVSDIRAIREGDTKVVAGWLWHIPAAILVLAWLKATGKMPLWAYGLAVYAGISFLKIRTFAEHQAHVLSRGRSVIIEDRGFLAFLFLNNNLHAVHHMHPKLPWYALPSRYFERQTHYLRHNGGYRFSSYADVFRRYFLSPKDPVPHPLWSRDEPPA